jgi:hypothetical protein
MPAGRPPARTAAHGQDGWLGTGSLHGWSCSGVTDSNATRAAEGRRLRRVHTMGQRAASTNERLMHTRAGVQHAAKTRGAAHEQPRDALGGLWPRAAMPPHPCAMCGEASDGAGDGSGAQAEDQAKASWRTRAGAMGGGSAESCRCWRIFRMTSPCVMAAIIRSAPR